MGKRSGTYKNTSAETAGEQNMTPEKLSQVKIKPDKYDELNKKCLNRVLAMKKNRSKYHDTWTEEEFSKSIDDFFQYCYDHDIEPSKPALAIWLDCSKNTLSEWAENPRFGYKHEIVNKAFEIMEMIYFNKLDGSPVPSMFKLKTRGFGYNDQNPVQNVVISRQNDEETLKNVINSLNLHENENK